MLSWICKKQSRAAHLRNSQSVARGLLHTTCRKKHLPSTTHPQPGPAQGLLLNATFSSLYWLHSLELRMQLPWLLVSVADLGTLPYPQANSVLQGKFGTWGAVDITHISTTARLSKVCSRYLKNQGSMKVFRFSSVMVAIWVTISNKIKAERPGRRNRPGRTTVS